MRTILSTFIVLGIFAAFLWIESPQAQTPATKTEDQKQKDPPKKHRGKFTIGKETTYVTGPLDKDGYVDYAAALNERLGKGVTPENNANVLLWKALGPHPDGATMPVEFFKLLGIDPPPEKGEYFIDLPRYLKEQLEIDTAEERENTKEELWRATLRPWTAKDYPNLAAWLKANEKPLAMVVEATKRSHYFLPLTPPKTDNGSAGLLIGVLLPSVQICRDVANALAARAMLRAGQGAADDAWQDLLTCHRLGRLVGRGGTLVEVLATYAIDGVACRAELAFLDRTKPNAKQIEKCLRDLQKLPPLPLVAEKLDLGGRFEFLDAFMMIVRQVDDAVEEAPIDWDRALQNGNRLYDRIVAALRTKDRGSRDKQLAQIEADVKALRAKLADKEDLERRVLGDDSDRGEVHGDMVVCSMVPTVSKLVIAADRVQQVQDNVILAFALAHYQREHGHYPKELAALAPKYLERIPQDVFSGQPLIYRPRENGYLLYSVGVNGKDEDGRGPDDEPPGDDLSVRMPLPERKPRR